MKTKDNRWIIQKNISSSDEMLKYIKEINNNSNEIDYKLFIDKLNLTNSNITSESTLGVRMSQMAFYMFGYKSNDEFVPSVITQKYLNNKIGEQTYGLINLFSMQYPHPFSQTPNTFKIFMGRLILKLLTDKRLEKKLYIDEFIWFLPFVETIDEVSYDNLVKEIIEYRNLGFSEKKQLFELITNFADVFSNITHEFNYYFIRIFTGFDVLETIEDKNHNNGNLFKFKHGETETYRSDAFKSNAKYSGYVRIKNNLYSDVEKLLNKFSVFDTPSTQATSFSKEYWLKDLYEFNMIDYLSAIEKIDKIDETVKEMIYLSKFGSDDGKDFEKGVRNVFELFNDIVHTEIISGSGDTDVLCIFENIDETFKFNVDAKKSKKGLSQVNPVRIANHLKLNDSKYAIIVTSRFSSGANNDISGYSIVNLEAEVLGKYVLKNYHKNGNLLYNNINKIVETNLGSNISSRVEMLTDILFS